MNAAALEVGCGAFGDPDAVEFRRCEGVKVYVGLRKGCAIVAVEERVRNVVCVSECAGVACHS